MALVKEVYRITASFPKEELYALTTQMWRAAVSIPSNIAEGAARNGNKEFVQFLSIARGSLSELETQLLIAHGIGYLKDNNDVLSRIEHVFALLGGLINSLRKRIKS